METNRTYFYKGNEYRVSKTTLMKDSQKNWITAVNYHNINNPESDYIRSEEQFKDRFIPSVLEVGEKVVVMSHGKLVGVTEVKEVMEDFASVEKSIGDAPKTVIKEIQGNGFIMLHHHWEYWFYNETTCKTLGIEFKK